MTFYSLEFRRRRAGARRLLGRRVQPCYRVQRVSSPGMSHVLRRDFWNNAEPERLPELWRMTKSKGESVIACCAVDPTTWRDEDAEQAGIIGGALLLARLVRALGALDPDHLDFSIFYIAARGWLHGEPLGTRRNGRHR